MGALRLVLGDQLSDGLAALRDADPETDLVLMAEVRAEATYVKHHKAKIVLVFAAMRHFAERLRGRGFEVRYVRYDDPDNQGSLKAELARALETCGPFDRVVVTKPGEWRLVSEMEEWGALFPVPVELVDDDRFVSTPREFADWAEGRKQLRMEYFYRDMRRKTGLLMDGDEPAGGQWNFDHDNRKSLPRSVTPPPRWFAEPDAVTGEVIELVEREFGDHFGSLERFGFAVTTEGAEAARDHFIGDILPGFGDYQDAMAKDEPWMWHSLLSVYINCGLLDALDVCQRAETAWAEGAAPLNAVEGFIRQIIGWRDYVRGLYWLKMPDYKEMNALGADRPLPDFYWTGETDMACMAAAIGQTRDYAYAHHIQRLMVTGNFALLAGLDPQAVNDWYMVVYADAYEWVELPNVTGMALFADGGIMASKPYAASGSYINRMSDYCKGCRYSVKARVGEDACPFNALYWDFIARNEERLSGNPRMGLIYRNLAKQDPDDVAAMRTRAAAFLQQIGVT
ncbi:MAG: cryptochrome/photolyase family protein [Pseudomonadota bacterium]